MSLLTPERVPVKVYRWDDEGAPALDKTPNCVATIFKACLVTGYGTKDNAGWTMPFEDTTTGAKVLRPGASPHTDFFFRLSADTGTEINAQIYFNMTDANTGDLKVQYAMPFKYAKKNSTGKWLLIASSRGVVFCCEQSDAIPSDKRGSFLYLGDMVSKIGARNLYLQYTSGQYDDAYYANMLGWLKNTYETRDILWQKPLMITSDGTVVRTQPISVEGFNGTTTKLKTRVFAPIVFDEPSDIFYLPGVYTASDGASNVNFDELSISNGSSIIDVVVFGTGGYDAGNFYFATKYWA